MENLASTGVDTATDILTNENILNFFQNEHSLFIIFAVIICVFVLAFSYMMIAANSMRALSKSIIESNMKSKADNKLIRSDISHLKDSVESNANNVNSNLQNFGNVLHELRTDINEQTIWCKSRNQ